MSDFEYSVPVLIAGGGACGAVAALAASDAGAAALVVERDDRPGGSTGMSQGLFCAAGTQSQRTHGIDDNADIFFADIMEKSRGQADPLIARTLARESAPTLEWLRTAHDLPWELDVRFRASYGNTRQRVHGWSGHGGRDMIQLLHRRMSDAGIDVLMEARLVEIFDDGNGRITGAALQRGNGEVERIGCDALILACGGFGANREMTEHYMPETRALRYNGHESSEGDAIRLAEALGAAVGDMGSYQGYAMLADPHGISVPPPVLIEGGVIVNRLGDRFTDESEDIAGMVHPLSRQPDGGGWVIYDAAIEAACCQIPELAELMALQAHKSADDLAGLAHLIGADPARLIASIEPVIAAASRGEADSFGRNWAGGHKLQPSFRALRVTGAVYHTQGGLLVDEQARVLRQNGLPFANLFAGGGSARSVSGSSSWGYLPAMGLTTAVVLGRIAGQTAGSLVTS